MSNPLFKPKPKLVDPPAAPVCTRVEPGPPTVVDQVDRRDAQIRRAAEAMAVISRPSDRDLKRRYLLVRGWTHVKTTGAWEFTHPDQGEGRHSVVNAVFRQSTADVAPVAASLLEAFKEERLPCPVTESPES